MIDIFAVYDRFNAANIPIVKLFTHRQGHSVVVVVDSLSATENDDTYLIDQVELDQYPPDGGMIVRVYTGVDPAGDADGFFADCHAISEDNASFVDVVNAAIKLLQCPPV